MTQQHTGEHRTSNGHVSLKWLIGVLTASLAGLLWLYVNGVKQDAQDIERDQKNTDLRVGAVESDIASMRTELTYIRASLLRIESKLDRDQ